MSTSEKSYMPRAVSKSRSASARKMMYLTAASTKAGSFSIIVSMDAQRQVERTYL